MHWKKIKRNAGLSLIWLGLFATLYSSVAWVGTDYAIVRAITELTLLFSVYQLNKRVLMPRFLLREKKLLGKYAIYLGLTFIVLLILDYIGYEFAFKFVDTDQLYSQIEAWDETPEFTFEDFYELMFGSSFITASLLVVLLVSILNEQNRYDRQREQARKNMAEAKMQAELKYLKAQINPHFLFNALGSLHSMSYMKMEGLPDNIAKLSDMLRYLIYECKEKEVTLEKELVYLKSFIDFQLLRLDNPERVTFEYSLNNPETKIEPMLLEPLVENAFKHSGIDSRDDAFIHIKMSEENGSLNFETVNSVYESPKRKGEPGIGNQNIEHRLELRYPDRYSFFNNQKGNVHRTVLALKLT
ncbi:histidine kinase [Fulvitalea axinellae]|uniref:Histidine kinase n=1 Tax=Fulvitalea axinellae TaxID=1182444 RepID=A0AAU9CXI2_9BACT|nr:histidine kinase [Fulvitalea axinellae]